MNQTRTIRLPIHVIKEINVYLRAARELAQKLDREPSPEDVAHMLDRPIEEVKRMLGLNERAASVDISAERGSGRSLLDTIPDEQNPDPAVLLQDDDVQRTFTPLVRTVERKTTGCCGTSFRFETAAK